MSSSWERRASSGCFQLPGRATLAALSGALSRTFYWRRALAGRGLEIALRARTAVVNVRRSEHRERRAVLSGRHNSHDRSVLGLRLGGQQNACRHQADHGNGAGEQVVGVPRMRADRISAQGAVVGRPAGDDLGGERGGEHDDDGARPYAATRAAEGLHGGATARPVHRGRTDRRWRHGPCGRRPAYVGRPRRHRRARRRRRTRRAGAGPGSSRP